MCSLIKTFYHCLWDRSARALWKFFSSCFLALWSLTFADMLAFVSDTFCISLSSLISMLRLLLSSLDVSFSQCRTFLLDLSSDCFSVTYWNKKIALARYVAVFFSIAWEQSSPAWWENWSASIPSWRRSHCEQNAPLFRCSRLSPFSRLCLFKSNNFIEKEYF